MTLGEAKARLRALLDETGENPPGEGRLERFFEMGQREIALYWPPYKEKAYGEADARVLPEDCDCPLLSTIQQPTAEMGSKATSMLLKVIEGEPVAESERLQPRLLMRKTTKVRGK